MGSEIWPVNAARTNPPVDQARPWSAEDGTALRSHRLVKGDSQSVVGEFMKGHQARHGSQSFVSRVESGTTLPKGADLSALRSYLATPAEPERRRHGLRLLEELVREPPAQSQRVDRLIEILCDRLAGTTGPINEYEWYAIELLGGLLEGG